MQSFIVNDTQTGRRIVQVLTEIYPEMSLNTAYKALREKNIKINDKRINKDVILEKDDNVKVYVSDSLLIRDAEVVNVYEDDNILVVNKPQGLKVMPDDEDNTRSLIGILRNKYSRKIDLCHRLDRNTGGLLITGKHKEATSIIADKIGKKEITKIYRCRVHGKLPKERDELTAYHLVKRGENMALIYDEFFRLDDHSRRVGKIITIYDLLSYDNITDTSIADINLVTGKMHQIRAHMAHIGHPIVGDEKYCPNELKKRLGERHKYQLLFAHKLRFNFSSPAGILDYLKGKTIEITPPL